MKINDVNQLEKGSLLTKSSGPQFYPSRQVNHVKFNGKNVGVGLYLGDSVVPETAIIKDDNAIGGKRHISELKSDHRMEETVKSGLENVFKTYYSD